MKPPKLKAKFKKEARIVLAKIEESEDEYKAARKKLDKVVDEAQKYLDKLYDQIQEEYDLPEDATEEEEDNKYPHVYALLDEVWLEVEDDGVTGLYIFDEIEKS